MLATRTLTLGGINAAALALVIACSNGERQSNNHGASSSGSGNATGGARADADSPSESDSAGQSGAASAAGGASETQDPSGAGGEASDPSEDIGASGHADQGEAGQGSSSGGTGGYATDSAGSGGTPTNGELMIPCGVYSASSVCRTCHSDPPVGGAPFPLVTLAEVQANTVSEYFAVATGAMPPAGGLSAQDADLLLDWLLNGAKGVPKANCP